MKTRPHSIFLLGKESLPKIYSPESISRIRELTHVSSRVLHYETWENYKDLLRDVEIIFSGWGMPPMGPQFLDACPKLRHVFYGSGSVRSFYTQDAQERGIRVSSSWRANAIPTADYSHALIILALKKFYRVLRLTQATRAWELPQEAAGTFGSTVGLVSLGTVGRLVAEHLRDKNSLRVLAYDPFVTDADASALGVEKVDLETLFSTSDVISLHAPGIPETEGLVSRKQLEIMKLNATLINTARGRLIDEMAFAEVFKARTDLDAFIDVTRNEPNNQDSPLWELPNVCITPHIAGSLNSECQRMGEFMVEELERYLTSKPLLHEVTPDLLVKMA